MRTHTHAQRTLVGRKREHPFPPWPLSGQCSYVAAWRLTELYSIDPDGTTVDAMDTGRRLPFRCALFEIGFFHRTTVEPAGRPGQTTSELGNNVRRKRLMIRRAEHKTEPSRVLQIGMVGATLLLSGCGFAGYGSIESTPGFFMGLWHGLIAPWTLILRAFIDMQMYAFPNGGWLYDLGFLFGVALSLPIGWIAALIALVVTIVF